MRKDYPLIGLSGRARSGKDTVRDFILACRGGYSYSFADPIYAMVHYGLGLNLREEYWQKRKEEPIEVLGKSPRQILQTLGTEWGRQMVHPDLWLILAKAKLMELGPGMVIADVRFNNEATWIRANGGVIVHIDRPDATKVNPHASEQGVTFEEGDIVIHNHAGLAELQARVRELFDPTNET